MKIITTSILYAIIICICVYLSIAFYELTFDVAKWSKSERGGAVFSSLILWILSFIVRIEINEIKINK